MDKYKYLLKNVGVLTLSNFATKILRFLLVPLYTNILSTTEYGTYELLTTTISLLVPILTIDIQEAVLRFAIDKETDKNGVFTVGISYSLLSSTIVFAFVCINYIFKLIPILSEFGHLFFTLYVLSSISGVLLYFVRGIARINELSISSVISSATIIFSNVLFLAVFHWGLRGYFVASILGILSQLIYLTIALKIWRYCSVFYYNKRLKKEMSSYSIPMVANAVSWWINNASDRYIVTWLCGLTANGVYSVAYKIPSIMNIFQTIFGQAWTLSAVKEFDAEDKSGFFSNIYKMYNMTLVFICSLLIVFNRPIARLLFAKDFFEAWKFAPLLLISTIFTGMSAFIGGLLSALKLSNTFAKTSVFTAIINSILNLILVRLWGPVGAAISTAFSYFVMWVLRIVEIRKQVNLNINLTRDLFSYIIVLLQALFVLNLNSFVCYTFQFLLLSILFVLYKSEIISYIQIFLNRKTKPLL